MKNFLRANGWLASLVLASFILAGLAGCGGCSTFGRTTYQSTGVAVVTVDAAMSAWGSYVSKNHPGAEKERKVAEAYAKYQQSINLIADTAIAYQNAKAKNDPSLPVAQANLNAVISASAAALADLEGLIVSFGVKL